MEFKALKEKHREENKIVGAQHEQIFKFEEKCKKLTQMIKDQKTKNSTQRSNAAVMHTDATKNKLEEEVKELEEAKTRDEKKYKQAIGKIDT